jgi:hypothetical protein
MKSARGARDRERYGLQTRTEPCEGLDGSVFQVAVRKAATISFFILSGGATMSQLRPPNLGSFPFCFFYW